MKVDGDLYGLILAGGRSSRMGFDKGQIRYRQLPHRQYLYKLLERFCSKAFMGIRPDQQQELAEYPLIMDDEQYAGPFRSILAAHDQHPDKAWLVMACDLPYITENTIRQLVTERDSSLPATAFYNRSSGFLEPLIAIWEPEVLRKAKAYVAEGGKCPRRFLLQHDIKQIQADKEQELSNANYPEDYEQAKQAFEGS